MEGETPTVPTGPLNRDLYIVGRALRQTGSGGAAENLARDNHVLSELLHSPQTIIQRKTRDKLVNHILTTGNAEQRRVLVDQIAAETERGRGSLMERVEHTAQNGRTVEERQWALVTLAQAEVNMEDQPTEQNRDKLDHLKGIVSFNMVSLARMIQSDLPLSDKDNTAIVELLGHDRRNLPFEGFDTCAVLASEASPGVSEKVRTRVYAAVSIALTGEDDEQTKAKLEAVKERVAGTFHPGVQAFLKDGLALVGHENNIEKLLPGIFDSEHSVVGLVETMRRMAAETDSETRRSIASFAAIVLELYAKRQKYGGKDVYKMDLRFDRILLPRTILVMDLPEDTAAVGLLTTHCENPGDERLWKTRVLVKGVGDDRDISHHRMYAYVAGQKPDGMWELAGSFPEVLEERPGERVTRIINERWQGEAGQSVETRAQIAAEEVLSRAYIEWPSMLGEQVIQATKDLEGIKGRSAVSPWNNREGYIAQPEFQAAAKKMAVYFLTHSEGLEKAIQGVLLREDTGFYGYDLDHDPLGRLKTEKGYQKTVEISFSDQDRPLD